MWGAGLKTRIHSYCTSRGTKIRALPIQYCPTGHRRFFRADCTRTPGTGQQPQGRREASCRPGVVLDAIEPLRSLFDHSAGEDITPRVPATGEPRRANRPFSLKSPPISRNDIIVPIPGPTCDAARAIPSATTRQIASAVRLESTVAMCGNPRSRSTPDDRVPHPGASLIFEH